MNENPLQKQLEQSWQGLIRLRVVLFLVVLVMLYGFIVWRIETLSTAEPDAAAVATQTKATSKPHLDQALVDKINQLESTNVTVKALFDQARKNPFRE
jgi:hypothetical protein